MIVLGRFRPVPKGAFQEPVPVEGRPAGPDRMQYLVRFSWFVSIKACTVIKFAQTLRHHSHGENVDEGRSVKILMDHIGQKVVP